MVNLDDQTLDLHDRDLPHLTQSRTCDIICGGSVHVLLQFDPERRRYCLPAPCPRYKDCVDYFRCWELDLLGLGLMV